MTISPKAERNWNRASHAYQYYIEYIETKKDKLALSVTDLVYLKNFKGGSATISEPGDALAVKLRHMEDALRAASKSGDFDGSLGTLSDSIYESAKSRMIEFVKLSLKPDVHISGLGVSFTSALLHFFFPNVVPILDRRAVNGANLYQIQRFDVDNDNQIKDLLVLYPLLIDHFRRRLRSDKALSLRVLDHQLFIEELRAPFKRKDKKLKSAE